jgi:hypothetical protein
MATRKNSPMKGKQTVPADLELGAPSSPVSPENFQSADDVAASKVSTMETNIYALQQEQQKTQTTFSNIEAMLA